MIRMQQIFLLLPIALVGACGGPSGSSGNSDHGCPGSNPGLKPVNIKFEGDHIKVTPPLKTVDEGDVLRFNLPGADNVLVSINGKTPEAGWLNGSGKKKPNNKASEHFIICVPRDLFPEDAKSGETKDFYYNVNAVGKIELDPRIRVTRN